MKANAILLYISSLSIFLFNNWNPPLGDLGLTMSMTPCSFSFFLSRGSSATVAFSQELPYRARLTSETWDQLDVRLGTGGLTVFYSLIHVSEISILGNFVWVYTIPLSLVTWYSCTGSSCLENNWGKPQWLGVWFATDTHFEDLWFWYLAQGYPSTV